MMKSLNKVHFIVDVNNRTKGVDEQGFGLILVLDDTKDIPYTLVSSPAQLMEIPKVESDLVKELKTKTNEELKSMLEEKEIDFKTDATKAELIKLLTKDEEVEYVEITEEDKVYKIVNKIFMQTPKLQEVAIYGKQEGSLVSTLNELINNQRSDWFSLTCTNNTDETVKDLAEWCTANDKIYYVTTQNKTLPPVPVKNATVMYHENPDDYTAEGLAAVMSAQNPGSTTAMYEEIQGSIPADITLTELDDLTKRNILTYIRAKGRNYVSEGTTLSGDYLDIVLGAYFIKFRAEEELFLNALNKRKIGYDDRDIGEMSGIVRGVLNRAAGDDYKIILVKNDIPQYNMTVLSREDMPKNMVANRDYTGGIRVEAAIAGAIHKGRVIIDLVI